MEPKRFRETLEQLGPTAMKIGQFLALRPDLIPSAYTDELLALADAVPAVPVAEILEVIEEDLGPIEAHFTSIEPAPAGSGSLAQVHRARLLTGEDVAIKVQRRGVRERGLRDLRAADWLGRVLEACVGVTLISPRAVIEEFHGWMTRELDFQLELQNTRRMQNTLRSGAVAPRVFEEHSKGRILALEFLHGVPMRQLLRMARANDFAGIEALDIDRHALTRRLLTSMLEQLFQDGVFHGDPHPGNLLALPHSQIGFLDFGLVSQSAPSLQKGLSRYLASVYRRDTDGMYKALTEILEVGDDSDLAGFRQDFFAASADWERERTADAPARAPLAVYLVAILTAARNHRLRVPTRILGMYRALVTVEAQAFELSGEASLLSVGRTFFAGMRRQAISQIFSPESVQATGLEMMSLTTDGPGQLRRLLADLSDERFQLQVIATPSKTQQMLGNARFKLVAVSLLVVAIAILLASGAEPRWLLWSSLGIAGVAWLWGWRRLG